MSMLKYIARRLLQLIPVLLGAITLSFILSRALPGDPVLAHLPHMFTQEMYDAKLHELGLDKPILEQFFIYLGDLFTGNWGISVSVSKGEPVWNLIGDYFPRTLDLAIWATIISSFVGLKTGVTSATNRNKRKDTIIRSVALLGVSIPVFWMGMLLQYAFAYKIPIFEGIGYKNIIFLDPPAITNFYFIDSLIAGRPDQAFDYVWHMFLPVFCLSFITLASVTRQTRSSMLEVLELDYIRTARAKGCDEKTVINSHALKNALIPTVTIIGLNFAGLLSGAILTETTFNLHGIGELLLDAILLRDYWVLNGLVFLVTLLFVLVNLFIDILYAFIDPRIRYD